MEQSAMLRFADVVRLTRLSKATLYRMIRAGTFPRPVKLGKRAIGFPKDEVEKWLTSRKRT